MSMPPVGVLQVPCPVCRAKVGRRCHNRRGYLTDAHAPRTVAWMRLEREEAREVAIPSGSRAGRDVRVFRAV